MLLMARKTRKYNVSALYGDTRIFDQVMAVSGAQARYFFQKKHGFRNHDCYAYEDIKEQPKYEEMNLFEIEV